MLHDLTVILPKHKLNGYPAAYYPAHPNSYGNGLILYHRLVMENKLGRYLGRKEEVHHKYEDISDYSPGNLEVLTSLEHKQRHRKERFKEERRCVQCGGTFQVNHRSDAKRKCSWKCLHMSQRRAVRPSAVALKKLVWQVPVSTLAVRFGVSDNAIGKWCKQYGVAKPPRGYWAKRQVKAR